MYTELALLTSQAHRCVLLIYFTDQLHAKHRHRSQKFKQYWSSGNDPQDPCTTVNSRRLKPSELSLSIKGDSVHNWL